MQHFLSRTLHLTLPLCMAITGCIGPLGDAGLDADADETSQALAVAPNVEIAFTSFEDPAGIGSAGQLETKQVIRSAQAYKQLFGHAAPAEVNFAGGDQVIFYSAGRKPNDGFRASVTKIERRGLSYFVSTQLVQPGRACAPLPSPSIPYTLVRFASRWIVPQPLFAPTVVSTFDCTEPAPEGPFCGGFAGRPCEGAAECVDNPADSCDPRQGGADCGGICQCKVREVCRDGQIWDGSSDVCGCVTNPCAFTLCPLISRCEVIEGEAVCVPTLPPRDPCAQKICPVGSHCVAPADAPICVR